VDSLRASNLDLQAGKYTATEEGLRLQVDNLEKQIQTLQDQINQINSQGIQDQLVQVSDEISKLEEEIIALEKERAALPVTETLRTVDQRTRAAEITARLEQLRQLMSIYQQIQVNLIYIGQPVQSGSSREDFRLTSLQSTLNLYQQLYLNTLNNLESVRLTRLQSTPDVTIVESATKPTIPIRPQLVIYMALGGLIGLIIATTIVVLIDFFDTAINSAPQVERSLGIPVVGVIADIRSSHKERLVAADPYQAEAEAFRMLEINLGWVAGEKGCRTLLVTSPGAGEGKTVVAANLAASMAHMGKRVVLIDANLRRPRLHAVFNVENKNGFGDMLGDLPLWVSQAKLESLETSQGRNFFLLPAGTPAANPAELLQGERLTQVFEKLFQEVDVIVLDGAPLFVSDSQILASKVDGVLLVIQSGFTQAEIAQTMLTQLKRVEAHVLGVALNRIPHSDVAYYKSYRSYSPAVTRPASRFSLK
jgi:capsular exopolysaccharide synthesis family protein